MKYGTIDIFIGEGKNKIVLAILNLVLVFGEMSFLLKDKLRTANDTALASVKVAKISKSNFDDFFNSFRNLFLLCLKLLLTDSVKQTKNFH